MTRHNAVRYTCDTTIAVLWFWLWFWLLPQMNHVSMQGWVAVRDFMVHPTGWIIVVPFLASPVIIVDWLAQQTDVLMVVFVASGFAGLWVTNQLGYDIDHVLPGTTALVSAALVTLAVEVFVLRPHPKGIS
jgi:hypothetical protein